MTRHAFTLTVLGALFLASCKDAPKNEHPEVVEIETIESVKEDIVSTSYTNKEGKVLTIDFNNTEGTALLNFDGEPIELVQERSGSGIWYKNDTYDLRGKGNDVTLKKDGEVVFVHEDEIIKTSYKDDKGATLDVTINATTNDAKVYLNGGEQIDLVGQKPASGIWYKNDQYELRGKGEKLELTKDGETVFKN